MRLFRPGSPLTTNTHKINELLTAKPCSQTECQKYHHCRCLHSCRLRWSYELGPLTRTRFQGSNVRNVFSFLFTAGREKRQVSRFLTYRIYWSWSESVEVAASQDARWIMKHWVTRDGSYIALTPWPDMDAVFISSHSSGIKPENKIESRTERAGGGGREGERERETDWLTDWLTDLLTDWTLLRRDKGLGTNAFREGGRERETHTERRRMRKRQRDRHKKRDRERRPVQGGGTQRGKER